ncbi:MAG: carboxypeptidase-like regulatory domain-containing protein [Candidatus Sumerlaeia bacterium]|nr:carboxypeptidase-like regulatory domain-containing protein [Candidatus Sumerlaeia bacterium]
MGILNPCKRAGHLLPLMVFALLGHRAGASVQIQISDILYSTDIHSNTSHQPIQSQRPWVQYAPNGAIGIVYKTSSQSSTTLQWTLSLVYRVFNPDGTSSEETIKTLQATGVSQLTGYLWLFYDSWLQPHILNRASESAGSTTRWGFNHYWKSGATWRQEFVEFPFAVNSYDMAGDMSADGIFHILVRDSKTLSTVGKAAIDYNLYYMTNRTGAWTYEVIDHRLWTDPAQLLWWNTQAGNICIVADNQGYAHIAYVVVYQPSPWYATAECRYMTNRSGAWQSEIVFGPGDYDAFAGNYPCLAVTPAGNPAMTTVYQSFAKTGSLTDEYLCYAARVGPNAWQKQTVVTSADGYYGTDGNHFTGVSANLRFDQYSRPHIVFSDRACYHEPYQRTHVGQIRYGFHNGSSWEFTTLYRQPRPDVYSTSEEMRVPNLAVSPGGGRIAGVGARLVRVGETYKYRFDVVRLFAINTAGDDAANTLRISGWTTPQTWLTFQSASGLMRAKVQASASGGYLFSFLPQGWSGTVTPGKTYCAFSPPSRTYNNLAAHQDNQNFTLVTGAIEGSVRNTETGRQPSGVLVKLFRSDGAYTGSSQTSDALGNFRFNSVEPGEYFLALTLAGYKPGRWPYDGCFVVQSNQTYTRWQIPISPLATRAARWTAYR